MQHNKMSSIKVHIINSLYFATVVLVALFFTTLGLARRINTYDANRPDLQLEVQKDEIDITNVIAAQVAKIHVQEGQSVKKGDILVDLVDDVLTAKLSTLEEAGATNESARTEAEVLRVQQSYYQIQAPQNGVIYQIHASEGNYLSSPTKILTIFSDQNVSLEGMFTARDYAGMLKQKSFDVYSPRLEQIFEVTFTGVSRVSTNAQGQADYELSFSFSNPDDSVAFIQGEKVSVAAKTRTIIANRPEAMIKRFWNSFILGSTVEQHEE